MITPHEGQVERANTLKQQAAANSGISKAILPRQTLNDREAFEALLETVFNVLTGVNKDTSTETRNALEDATKVLQAYAAAILIAWCVPSPWSLAEEAVQDFYVRVLSRNLIHRYDHRRSSRRTFVFAILRRVLSEAFRKAKPNRTVPLPANLLDTALYPDEVLAMHELRGQVGAAIGRLRPCYANVIRASYGIDGESEVGPISRSAYDTRMFRARRKLRSELENLSDS